MLTILLTFISKCRNKIEPACVHKTQRPTESLLAGFPGRFVPVQTYNSRWFWTHRIFNIKTAFEYVNIVLAVGDGPPAQIHRLYSRISLILLALKYRVLRRRNAQIDGRPYSLYASFMHCTTNDGAVISHVTGCCAQSGALGFRSFITHG